MILLERAACSQKVKSLHKVLVSNLYAFALFITALVVYFCCIQVGWHNTILDNTAHRQSQTAINTYYVLKDGLRPDYATPVLGKPWSIPHEAPIYEWLVAGLKLLSPLELDQCGRLISVICFLGSLIPIWMFLNTYVQRPDSKLLCLALILASPIYMFWSRTFMIESLALLLSLYYVVAAQQMLKQTTTSKALLVALIGSLAALAKATTFSVALVPCTFLFLHRVYLDRKFLKQKYIHLIIQFVCLFAIPMSLAIGWIIYSDHLKLINPLGHIMLTSGRLKGMVFGSIQQRLNLNNWLIVGYKGIVHAIGSWWIAMVPVLCLIFYNKYRYQALLCACSFLAGPIVFFNLYLVHEYYCYASNIYLLIGAAFALLAAYESAKCPRFIKLSLFPIVMLSMYSHWWPAYGRSQASESNQSKQIVHISVFIKEHTLPTDILVIDGWDWNPSIPYYSERKALMRVLSPDKYAFEQAVNKTSDEHIGAFVIVGIGGKCKQYVDEQTTKFHVSNTPALCSDAGDVYLARCKDCSSAVISPVKRTQ